MEFNRFLSHAGLDSIHLHDSVCGRCRAIFEYFETVESGALFCASCAAAAFRPFEFHAQDALAFPFRGKFHLLALSFQFQKTGIVGIVAVHFSVADFENAVRHFIQEITVMGDHKDGSAVIFQVILEPGEHRIVEMVCRLVEDQDVKIGRKHFCQGNLAALAAREGVEFYVVFGDTELYKVTLHLPVLLITGKGVGQHGGILWKFRCLRKIGHFEVVLADNLAGIRGLLSCCHAQQRGFSGSVDSDDADLVALLQAEGSIVKNQFIAEQFADVFDVDDIHLHSSATVWLMTFPSALPFISAITAFMMAPLFLVARTSANFSWM